MSQSGTHKDRTSENLPLPVKEWSSSDLVQWMRASPINERFKDEEISLLEGAEISGRTLQLIDRQVLTDVGIQSVGRQLEILQSFKDLTQQNNEEPRQVKENKSSKWKRKITREDQMTWNEANRNLYRVKIAVIRRECLKVWPGNQKIYFKQNQANLLKLEELTSKLGETCSVPEIGFGTEAIRSHILQWAQEKNRRLSDGYDFEVEHTRAKRARKAHSTTSPSSSEGGDTEVVDSDETDETVHPVEHNIDKLSRQAAKVVLLVALNANSFDNISVKGSLIPLAKHLKVKVRGMGKYDMAILLAKQLIKQDYVVPVNLDEGLNFNCIKRKDIACEKDIYSFVHADKGSPNSASSSSGSSIPADDECKEGISSAHAHKYKSSKGGFSVQSVPSLSDIFCTGETLDSDEDPFKF